MKRARFEKLIMKPEYVQPVFKCCHNNRRKVILDKPIHVYITTGDCLYRMTIIGYETSFTEEMDTKLMELLNIELGYDDPDGLLHDGIIPEALTRAFDKGVTNFDVDTQEYYTPDDDENLTYIINCLEKLPNFFRTSMYD